jgi:hypothetical protein
VSLHLIDRHRDVGVRAVVVTAQQVFVIAVGEQLVGVVVEMPAHVHAGDARRQLDVFEQRVVDSRQPELLVEGVGLGQRLRQLRARMQRADEAVADDGARHSPQRGRTFGVVGRQCGLVLIQKRLDLIPSGHSPNVSPGGRFRRQNGPPPAHPPPTLDP